MSPRKILGNLVFLLASGTILASTASAGAKKLNMPEIIKNMSSSLSKAGDLSEGRIIVDNDESFQSKLDIIDNAEKTLRLTYFIYTNDFSSSVFTAKLIRAANKGVKVRLIVDALTNYKYLDLFSMMEREGNGNLEVKLYNLPSEKIMKDILFMTTDCTKTSGLKGTECETEKRNKIAWFLENRSMTDVFNSPEGHFAQLFLAGFMTKQMDAMKSSLFVGQNIDMAALGKASSEDPEKKDQLMTLLKLIIKAKMGDVGAKVQLGLALMFHSDEINPVVNEINGKIPMMGADPKDGMGAEWAHFTDYTHQKLILADGGTDSAAFQVGGRNIEDSYHMKRSETLPVHKYIFMDTDFVGKFQKNSEQISASFDRLWNWTQMVKNLDYVRKILPNDIVVDTNIQLYMKGLGDCIKSPVSNSAGIAKCTKEKFEIAKTQSAFLTLDKRMNIELGTMDIARAYYEANYRIENTQASLKLSANDLKTATISYVENVPYDLKNPKNPTNGIARIYGANHGKESSEGKYIHELWMRSMENVCATSAGGQERKQVILHNAYFFAPPILIETLGKMINGTWDCNKVDVTILTNSLQTTDLNIMNLFARHQIQALFEFYRNPALKSKKAATLNYFEYKEPTNSKIQKTGHAERSLHSKVAIFDKDIYVGSANLDIRNYAMDANNGVFIANAPDLAADYTRYFKNIINDRNSTTDWKDYLMNPKTTEATAQEEVRQFMGFMAEHRAKLVNKMTSLKPEDMKKSPEEQKEILKDLEEKMLKRKKQMEDLAHVMTEDVYKNTKIIILPVNGELNDSNQVVVDSSRLLPIGGTFEDLSEIAKIQYKDEIKKLREQKRLELIQKLIDSLQLI